MSIKEEVVNFLTKNRYIQQINFAFKKYKVYPSAYRKDVADAVSSGQIIIFTQQTMPTGGKAVYKYNYDRMEFGYGFDLNDYHCQADLIHESTHAHMDIQSFGLHSIVDNEAMAYVAEAVFLEASHKRPKDNSAIRRASHAIAKRIVAGTYWVPGDTMSPLLAELNKVPHYYDKMVDANGFHRNLATRILRHF